LKRGNAYSAGLRVSEVVALKPEDINSKRMCLDIRQGKGKKDRMVGLSPVLLVMLRIYRRAYKPKMYLFEGQEAGSAYTTRSLQEVIQQAKAKAKITKKRKYSCAKAQLCYPLARQRHRCDHDHETLGSK